MPYKDIRKRRKYDREHKRKFYPQSLTRTSSQNSTPKNIEFELENKTTEGLINGLEEKDITFVPHPPTFTAEQKLKYAKWGIKI